MSVEGVVLQRPRHAERAGQVDVLPVSCPEAWVGVVEAQGETFVPNQHVSLRPVFKREGMFEILNVGQRFHSCRVVGEFAEVAAG